jgi:flagellar hook protein FlgE
MSRAIWASVSGLDSHQTWMDVLGNNIANVNTAGYKDSRFEFEDILSQSIKGAAPAVQGGVGGTNPEQVGLGTVTGSINAITTQGSLQPTNVPTDLAITGPGYYVVSDGTNQHFTRDSVFQVDGAGNVVNASTGLHLQGIVADQSGNLQFNRGLQNLTIPQTANTANNTSAVDIFGNLDSRSVNPVNEQVTAIDSLGQQHTVVLTFSPNGVGSGSWNVTATSPDLQGTMTVNNGPVTFNSIGQLTSNGTLNLTFSNGNPWFVPNTTTGSSATQSAINLTMNDGSVGSLTQFALQSSLNSQAAPSNPGGAGNTAAYLKSFSVDSTGVIRGQYGNGTSRILGQVELATFANPAGLQRTGQNDYDLSANSGQANVSLPGSGLSGSIAQGNIETSNVDLANELAQVILAQRGFSANSRMVTTSDEMLQDVVGMKR